MPEITGPEAERMWAALRRSPEYLAAEAEADAEMEAWRASGEEPKTIDLAEMLAALRQRYGK